MYDLPTKIWLLDSPDVFFFSLFVNELVVDDFTYWKKNIEMEKAN